MTYNKLSISASFEKNPFGGAVGHNITHRP